MTRIDDEREVMPPRVFLMPPPMVIGFPPFYHAAQPRFVERLPLLEPSPNSSVVIRQVWAANADSEFQIISSLIDKYRFVSIDTEFPGVVILPRNKNYRNLVPEETYQVMKANVDALKIIQLGLTLSDEHGNLPDLETNNITHYILAGVSSVHFAKLAAASGLLFNKALTWVTFHGAYDIGYLVKILTWGVLPTSLEEFLVLVKELFGGNAYDVKHVMRYCNGLYGGLEKVADTLQVDRVVGKCHQVGSDSLLTCHTFHKIRGTYFLTNDNGFRKYVNVFFGLEIAKA
ncbi:probable CCR4-associated factor 1 homolog 11 [Arachis ipaensis]|uniref:probable CCR4-associated factor 1 homolog 11 n=1 Tax=Arachis ipaensis TaxID=130454 RepID=UPI000A2B0636|nr:probable CCR4-associated factor 1 homolog 11 [Arachis ipaensis]XP_029147044.1 probable CCR4-associated factor 1 homolog 11 [Arachis hypogaea]QHO00572.1 uncharacterized protein DS421_13g407600 [Arachis hypogaea]